MATDADLLHRLLARRAWLIAWLRVILRDRELAEDVFQEVCVAVARRDAAADPVRNPDGYFLTVGRHLAFAALRDRARRQELPEAVLDVLAEDWLRPDPAADARLDALRHCIARLPAKSRRLVDLRYQEGHPMEEVAAMVGVTAGSLYVLYSRLHKALRDCVTRGLAAEGG